MGRPRSFACAVLALALVSAAAPSAPSAAAKGKHHHTYRFGTRPLSKGAKGKDVRFLQRALTRLGVSTSIDGVFGKGTQNSVIAFEQEHGWPADGVISRKEAGRIKKLLSRQVVSGSYFVFGVSVPTLNLTARRAGSATAKVVNAQGAAILKVGLNFGGPGAQTFTWNGGLPGGFAADGTYQMRLSDRGSSKAIVSGGQVQPFAMHAHAFPVPGPHTFGGPDARFGAPRSGHIHQGQDIPAACGQKEVAFETGVLKVNAYQAGGAGYYVVIHGTLTGTDGVYMHLQAPSPVPANSPVAAGKVIGKVGDTGDAQGCHLHFERWSAPGWYVGGSAFDPLPELQYWDSYS